MCTSHGQYVVDLEVVRGQQRSRTERDVDSADSVREVGVLIELEGRRDPHELVHGLTSLPGVFEVGFAEGSGTE